jgi:hypothetical protein
MPLPIKHLLRFFRYSKERRKVFREISIRREQDRMIKVFDSKARALIIFVVGGADWGTGKDKISGGVMSITSICEETARLTSIHDSVTLMCTHTDEHLFVKHTTFLNDVPVLRLGQLPRYFKEAKEVLIHVPEFLSARFFDSLLPRERTWLAAMKRVHLNILNQNIRMMPSKNIIRELSERANQVTVTTAHQKYSSRYFRDQFGVPLHKLSVWVSPEQFKFRAWHEKENLLVVSPDAHPAREEVLKALSNNADLKIRVIQGLTYEQYKELISKAKWSLTFGEGLDGYLVEPIFSGAIGFAVYNEDFFTPDFAELETIFGSFSDLRDRMPAIMKRLDKVGDFASYQQTQFDLCAHYYNRDQYLENLISFYKKEYTYA